MSMRARHVIRLALRLEIVLITNQIDIAVITESWISPSTASEQYSLEGYIAFSVCRQTRTGGGVLVMLKITFEHLLSKTL